MYGLEGCNEWCPFCDPSEENVEGVLDHGSWRQRLGWAIVQAARANDATNLSKLVAEWEQYEAKERADERRRLGPYVEPIGDDDPCVGADSVTAPTEAYVLIPDLLVAFPIPAPGSITEDWLRVAVESMNARLRDDAYAVPVHEGFHAPAPSSAPRPCGFAVAWRAHPIDGAKTLGAFADLQVDARAVHMLRECAYVARAEVLDITKPSVTSIAVIPRAEALMP
jgi:hypothetical protein